jgi:hypothetical protein
VATPSSNPTWQQWRGLDDDCNEISVKVLYSSSLATGQVKSCTLTNWRMGLRLGTFRFCFPWVSSSSSSSSSSRCALFEEQYTQDVPFYDEHVSLA